jgi:hypothetical protein
MLRARLGVIGSLALLLVLVHGKPASAAEAAEPATTTQQTTWYGYQVLLTDGASIGLGLLTDSPAVLIAGYLLGPIVIHGVDRRAGLAVVSPLVGVFLPVLGVAIGSQFKSCNAYGDECAVGGSIVGGSIGVAAAMILDWSLGWEKTSVPPAPKPRSAGFALSALGVAPREGGLNLVLGGRF